jgi:hypothetical protein
LASTQAEDDCESGRQVIYDVHIYNRPLSADEVAALAQQ